MKNYLQIVSCGNEFRKLLDNSRFTWNEITSPRRQASLVEERRRIATELRKQGFSYPVIGAVMNRDHTSILHLCGGGE